MASVEINANSKNGIPSPVRMQKIVSKDRLDDLISRSLIINVVSLNGLFCWFYRGKIGAGSTGMTKFSERIFTR